MFAYTENASISLCNGDNISTNNQVLMTYYDSSYEAPSIQNQMDLISVYDNNENLFKSSYIPKVYDSRDKGYVTAVKNQGGLGICWSYAAVAAMESYALSHGLVNDEIDLDEYALAYMSYDDNGYSDELGNSTGDVTNIMSDSSMYQCLMSGGNDYIAFKTLSKWAGIINQQSNHEGIYLETDYKFQSNDLSYILTGQKYINMSDTDLIKQAVMENGALTVYYNGSSTYFSDIDRYGKYSYNYENTFCNHAVALIGWDDSFDKNMFTVTDSDGNIHTPDNDGAWLVKNSWGTNKMFEGYTWISYDDKAINSCNAAIYEVANKQKYEHNYQYDGSTVFGSSASSFLMGRSYANVFCVNESNAQNLKAVSFATRDALRNYEIKIYKNPEKQKQSNTSDTTLRYNPESGTLMCTVNGTTTYAGYYTVTLPQDIILSAGDVFSIVVSFDQDTIMEHSLESCYVGAGANAVNVIDDNQSFFSKDGVDVSNKSYIDTAISGFRGMAYNYCIKAFTDDANVNDMVINEASILSVKQNNIDSIEIDWKSVNNATNYRLYRSDNMSSGYEIIYDGEQTLYYDSNIEIGKTYYYKTVAYNNNLNIRSEESDVSIIYVTLPAVNIKSCIGNQENITLSWSSLDGVDSYAIYRSDDNKHYDKIAEVSSNTTVYKDLNNNLKFNQNYYYIVKYYKYINGEKKESNSSVSEYAQKKLDRVNNINSDGTRYNSILLSWEENIKATGYKIMRTNNTNGAYIEIADVRGTYYRDDVSGLQKGTNISYIVQPYVLEDSEKKYGNTVSVHAFLRYEPLSNVCLNIVDGKLVATWDSFSGDSKYLSGYNIYI